MGMFSNPKTMDSVASSLDDIIPLLVTKVSECLSIDGGCPRVDDAFREACIKREILAMVQEGSIDGPDSVQVLTSRIRTLLTNSDKPTKRGKKNKRDELRLSKLDEWYQVQQYLVQEAKESEKKMARKKKEEKAKFQAQRRELLKEMNQKRLNQRKNKVEELRRVQDHVRTAEKEAALERKARKEAGQRLRCEREAQIELERKKKEIFQDIKKLMDQKERQAILESMREEQQMLQELKSKARIELESVLEENQKSQSQKLEQAKAEKEESRRCMEEYSRILLKQEEARKEQLKKIQAIQKAQETSSARQPLYVKKWVDDAVVAKQASELEKKQAEKEKNMLEQQMKEKRNLISILDAQVEEKRAERARERSRKADEKVKVQVLHQETKHVRAKELQRAAKACIRMKHGLDEQLVQQKKAFHASMGMNHLEKSLNATMLRQVKLA